MEYDGTWDSQCLVRTLSSIEERGGGELEGEEEEAAAVIGRLGLDQGQTRIAVVFSLGT